LTVSVTDNTTSFITFTLYIFVFQLVINPGLLSLTFCGKSLNVTIPPLTVNTLPSVEVGLDASVKLFKAYCLFTISFKLLSFCKLLSNFCKFTLDIKPGFELVTCGKVANVPIVDVVPNVEFILIVFPTIVHVKFVAGISTSSNTTFPFFFNNTFPSMTLDTSVKLFNAVCLLAGKNSL
jgi:hypothetical protein